MEDQLVSFETAKLAKEKGFNADSSFYYSEYGTLEGLAYYENFSNTGGDSNTVFSTKGTPFYEAPTQSLLQKWLREEKLLLVDIYYTDGNWVYNIHWKDKEGGFASHHNTVYETALEEGLEIALKLIR